MSASCCIDRKKPGICGAERASFVTHLGASRLASVACGLMFVLLANLSPTLHAQPDPQDAEAAAPADDLQRLPSDRKIAQQLQELSRLARGGNLTRIRDTLQLLRAAEPTLMVPDRGKAFRPLHRDLVERIQSFSPQLQAELLKDPGATPQSLQLAFNQSGPVGLLVFLHRFSGTTESLKAHLLLAAIHRDRGHRQGTLYWLAPVLHASAPPELRKIAVAWSEELKADLSGPNAESEDATLSPDGSDIDDELDRLRPPAPQTEIVEVPGAEANPSSAGNVADVDKGTSGSTQGDALPTAPGLFRKVMPTTPAWQQTLYLSSAQRRSSQDLVRLLATVADQRAIAWTVSEPIVEETAIYVRSSGGLLAYDRPSGKVLWTRLLDPPSEVRRMTGSRLGLPDGGDRSPMEIEQLQISRDVLDLHRDEVATRMTTDASRLFVISDTGESVGGLDAGEPFRMFQGRIDRASHSLRELVAIDKTTGRRLWSAGGVPMEESFGNELSQAWFAGPPTVSGSALYGVVEKDDAQWLVCLRSETGEVLWKQMLAFPETNVYQDSSRQLIASRPVVADGLIWTNTNDGWLFGFDELTRSTIWSRFMTRQPVDLARIRNIRRAIQQLQPPKPFRDSWRPVTMSLLADSLLLTGPESHQLLLLNPVTGSVRRRTSQDGATVIVYTDEESIVTAGPARIERLQLNDFKATWSTQLTNDNVVPSGPGALVGEHLMIPLTDGSIQAIRYSDGQLTDNLPGNRPAYSAGGLVGIDGDVVSYGVDHVSLYSQSGSAGPQEHEPIDQARFLIETGKFEEAASVLVDFAPTSEQFDTVQRLLFRTAAALALKDDDQRDAHLDAAARYATSTQDKAIVEFLFLETHPEITGDRILELLRMSPSVLNTELPDFEELKSQLLNPVVDVQTQSPMSGEGLRSSSSTRPLRHRFLQRLEEKLADPSASEAWISVLHQVSDNDLLSLNQPEGMLQEELLNRAESAIGAGRFNEATLHLMLQAHASAVKVRRTESADSSVPSGFEHSESRLTDLVERYEKGLVAESTRKDALLKPHPAALDLLAVLRSESLPASGARSESVSPQQEIARQWSTWKDQTYTLFPVTPVAPSAMMQTNERTLHPRSNGDQFLNGWRWSTIREPSVLAVRSMLHPELPLCTIDGGMFDALSIGNNGSVVRFGSVILVQNSMGLSAVSVIDQRVLWSRAIPNQPENILWNMMSELHLFNSFYNRQSAWEMIFGRELRICGGNERWICVQSPSGLEMIDLLTGQNLWSHRLASRDQCAFATESRVFATVSTIDIVRQLEGDRAEVCLNRIDGALQTTVLSYTQLGQTILATGDELVIWKDPDTRNTSHSLSWVDSESGEERRSVTLTNMLKCHFMDIRTLVSIRTDDSFEVVDLLTAQSQVVPLKDASELSEEAKEAADVGVTEKYMVVADAANYYVFPFPDRQAFQMQIMLGSNGDLNLYPIHEQLRAIDRANGKLRWVWKSEDNTAAWLDPTSDPVLLLVTNSNRKNKANGPPAIAIPGLILPTDRRTTITGLSRMSGTKLFDYQVSSRFPMPSLSFKITPEHYLDLQAFGNRVRFIPEANP